MRIAATASWLGDLLDNLNTELKNSEFIATLGIPIFDEEDPFAALMILESTLQFQLTKNIRTARNKLKIHLVDIPPSVEVILGIIVSLDNNPDLEFRVLGQFFASGSVVIAGEMVGMWHNAFGINGFLFRLAAISVGFVPTYISIGLGGELWIGSKKKSYCTAEKLAFLTSQMCSYSAPSKATEESPYGFREVAEFWCSLMPSGIPCVDRIYSVRMGLARHIFLFEWERRLPFGKNTRQDSHLQQASKSLA